ncbi:hypothetical protein MPNT_10123 [Candidatus Methylacidithermus pantelleriae]|uniref:Uncharacterized protein n=1 Tax=Candidatus Methylacidithermus pantelleriae TaxID=2744239 RepID=A0A8J2BQI1_9BACT|nr:hypothetical protein MPNT_10123 [Candidatus Methylacidithermus pantelleriae]
MPTLKALPRDVPSQRKKLGDNKERYPGPGATACVGREKREALLAGFSDPKRQVCLLRLQAWPLFFWVSYKKRKTEFWRETLPHPPGEFFYQEILLCIPQRRS